jgi:RNA polymerase sigma factor (sigma-70 family)
MLRPMKSNFGLAEILSGFSKNSNSSKEKIYKMFYGYVMAVIVRYTSNIHDSEELVNDSFIKIFRYIESFKPPERAEELEKAFKGWMAKIASRIAIDFIKKPRIDISESEFTDLHHPLTFPEEMLKLNVTDLMNLLNHLPEIQRLIFNLYEIEGFSHQEISKMLNIKENICRVYLNRAKLKLRTLYQINMEPNGTY